MVFKKILTFLRHPNKRKSRKTGKMSESTASQDALFGETIPNTSQNDSKSREVSPKLVVRGKKYGRRSRPQSAAMFESSQSDSEGDYDVAKVPVLGESKGVSWKKFILSCFARNY